MNPRVSPMARARSTDVIGILTTRTAIRCCSAVDISIVTLVLDLLGTFVFALSGAVAGVKHGSTSSAS